MALMNFPGFESSTWCVIFSRVDNLPACLASPKAMVELAMMPDKTCLAPFAVRNGPD